MTEAGYRDLSTDERLWLLGLARATIAARLAGTPDPDDAPEPGPLTEHRGAFVTLTREGALRGCIGHVIGTEPLWLSVRGNAANAAFKDPRFPPVTDDELPELTVEISALSPLRIVGGPDQIEVGRDGLIVECGRQRGLLLPQVAERNRWTAVEFLDYTCRKAGLAPGCWRAADARIATFSAEVFSEDDTA
jgi:AmmeMemoRadiSam system protein A